MGVRWAWVVGSGRSPAWIARVAMPRPSVRSRMSRPRLLARMPSFRPVYGRLRCPDGSDRLVASHRQRPRRTVARCLDPGRHAGFAGDAKAPLARAISTGGSGPTVGGSPTWCAVRSLPASSAIREYEASYRRYLHDRRALVGFLVETCGNVYDFAVDNVHDDDYDQADSPMNHYQDISVRRVYRGARRRSDLAGGDRG